MKITIVGAAGGNQYNIEAQAGSSLTLTGDLSNVDDTSTRFFNLSGPAGSSGRVEGKIIDRTGAAGVFERLDEARLQQSRQPIAPLGVGQMRDLVIGRANHNAVAVENR